MKKNALYPLKFTPILKEKVWGGFKLVDELKKSSDKAVGESWELSGVKGFVSEVANGKLRGIDLNELLNQFGPDLVGNRVYRTHGNEFPLLFKFIDAKQDLSVQLHPDDKLAAARHNTFGKTEMWYIVATDPGARLILGFEKEMDPATYRKYLDGNKITEILHKEEIIPGQAFFIAPGTVHAIGAGTLLAEIQQTSDITYRIYDWDRPDSNGELRELHTDLALDAIDFKPSNFRLNYTDLRNKRIPICTSQYFQTNKLNLTTNFEDFDPDLDSFRVFMCISGSMELVTESESIKVRKGETVLVPACIHNFVIKTDSAEILEVYIP